MSRFAATYLSLLVFSALLGLGLYAWTASGVTLGIEQIEERQALEDVVRVRRVQASWERQLQSVAGDWGPWTDSYALVLGQNPTFGEENLGEEVLKNLGVDLMLFTDLEGGVIESQALDERGHAIDIPLPVAETASSVVGAGGSPESVHGIVTVDESPVLVATAPITTSAGDAPPVGYVLVGRYLRDQEFAELSDIVLQQVSLHVGEASDLPHEASERLSRGDIEELFLIDSDDQVAGFGVERDIFGEPAFVFEVERSRPANALAQNSLHAFAWVLVAGWVVLSILVAWTFSALQRQMQVRDDAIAERDMFFASASHDLRTPLNSIIGFTGVVLSGAAGPLTHEQHTQLSMAYRSSKHLLVLVDDVLELQQGIARELDPQFAETDVCAVVGMVAERQRSQAENKGLVLAVASCPEPVMVNTDEMLLTRMLENLLSNAVKYTQQGSVGIDQSVEGAQVVVRVRDTGPGIPADALGRLFDPFYRVPGIGDPGRGDGTGLGLAIARRYANAVGATIEVQSEPGRGTTFTLRLKRT